MKFLKKIPIKYWIIFIACIIIIAVSYFRLAANLELLTYDFRLQLRPPLATLEDIVIIEIDNSSLERLGLWPFPRNAHATLLNYLRYAGAKVVFFDILFSDPSFGRSELPANSHGVLHLQSEDLDFAFEEHIRESGNVYLPEAFEIDESPLPGLQPPLARRYSASILGRFKQYVRGAGYINNFTDPDGKIRRIPLFIRYQNILVPHIALKIAADAMGLDVRKVTLRGRRALIDSKLSLPIADGTSFMINYPAGWVSSYTHVSYAQLIEAQNDRMQGKKLSFDPAKLKGKVCFVGLTATGTHDLKGMPLEELYPMIGLQASVYNSIMKKQFITDVGPVTNVLLNLFVFFVSLLVCFSFPPLKALWRIFIVAGVYFVIATGLLFMGLWIDLFLPLLVIAVIYVILTLYKFIEEVHKRQLIEKELDIARAIQKSFLPQEIKEFPGLAIASFMQPAKFVGGDLYDIFPLDDKKLGVFIGDVSGKGVPAALIMAQSISLFRLFARNTHEPAGVLTQLNKELCGRLEGRFVTAFYLIIDTANSSFSAACAGHLPLIIYNARLGQVSEVCPVSGPPIGVLDVVEFESFEGKIARGDRLILYTDGITEARNKKEEEFETKKLSAALLKNRNLPVTEELNKILEELFEFSHGLPQHDDITAILLEAKA